MSTLTYKLWVTKSMKINSARVQWQNKPIPCQDWKHRYQGTKNSSSVANLAFLTIDDAVNFDVSFSISLTKFLILSPLQPVISQCHMILISKAKKPSRENIFMLMISSMVNCTRAKEFFALVEVILLKISPFRYFHNFNPLNTNDSFSAGNLVRNMLISPIGVQHNWPIRIGLKKS